MTQTITAEITDQGRPDYTRAIKVQWDGFDHHDILFAPSIIADELVKTLNAFTCSGEADRMPGDPPDGEMDHIVPVPASVSTVPPADENIDRAKVDLSWVPVRLSEPMGAQNKVDYIHIAYAGDGFTFCRRDRSRDDVVHFGRFESAIVEGLYYCINCLRILMVRGLRV